VKGLGDNPRVLEVCSWEHLKTDFKGAFLRVNYTF